MFSLSTPKSSYPSSGLPCISAGFGWTTIYISSETEPLQTPPLLNRSQTYVRLGYGVTVPNGTRLCRLGSTDHIFSITTSRPSMITSTYPVQTDLLRRESASSFHLLLLHSTDGSGRHTRTNLDTKMEKWPWNYFFPTSERQNRPFCPQGLLGKQTPGGSYKLLTRWYWNTAKLHSIYPQVLDTCWHCGESCGTLLHIFWGILKIKQFLGWSIIYSSTLTPTGISLNKNPATYLLNNTPLSNKQFKNSLLKPVSWHYGKAQAPPIVGHWRVRIAEIQVIENLTMLLKEDKYWKIWTPYFFYRDQTPLASQT